MLKNTSLLSERKNLTGTITTQGEEITKINIPKMNTFILTEMLTTAKLYSIFNFFLIHMVIYNSFINQLTENFCFLNFKTVINIVNLIVHF